jgi:hypothetical protein
MTTIENEIQRIVSDTPVIGDRLQVLKFSIDRCIDDITLDYFEFGVFDGRTINYIASIKPHNVIYGFDSFLGLPRDWNFRCKKGAFNLNGKLPIVKPNIKLISGWYGGQAGTVKPFFENYSSNIGFIHIDCDLYHSTKIVFDNIHKFIQKDVVIQFDELINCHNSENHELKAWVEYVNQHNIKYEYLYRSTECQVSLKIL